MKINLNNKKAAIIIVNWNGLKFLNKCLCSVYNQSYKTFNLYFVDNGSKDCSVNFVKSNFPFVKIIKLSKNNGFAGGNNVGIKEALKDRAIKYIVFLNNDTIVDNNWLSELIKVAEQEDKIGMVSSKTILKNNKIHNIGLSLECGINMKNGGTSIGYNDDPEKYTKQIEVFAPGGVSALYKRRVLEKIGLFDEDFFCYAEDIDIGFRARLMGWKCIYSPKSKLIHLHSQTAGKASPFKAFYAKRNGYFYRIKNFPFAKLIALPFKDFFWLINNSLGKSKLQSVNKLKSNIGNMGMFKILLSSYYDIIKNTPKMLKKRSQIQKNKTVGNDEVKEWFKIFNRNKIESK